MISSLLAWLGAFWWLIRSLLGFAVWIALFLLVYFAYAETQSAELQARSLAEMGRKLFFQVGAGASEMIRFPTHGPFDERMGYAQLPAFTQNLVGQGYTIARQARWSPKLLELHDRGLFPAYREKTQTGLRVLDKSSATLFEGRYPERVYARFDAVPRVLVDTLLFIENRELLDSEHPKKNPAVEWDRLAKAVLDQALHALDSDQDTPGGSTLATQIEKYRHSPEGRTLSIGAKFRQMGSASVRAYLNGEDTTEARKRVVLDYLNTVPLAAKPGVGEINGIGDGLWAWFGRDFGEMNRILHETTSKDAPIAAQALAYKQALSLMISQRRPSYYLSGNQEGLDRLVNSHLRILAQAGVISPALRDAGLAVRLELSGPSARTGAASFVSRKAANAVRTELANILKTARLYDLDRFDLTVATTLDGELQAQVTNVLRGLRDPEQAKAAGLMETRILEKGDPAKVIYSFTLYERTPGGNLLRVQTDNYDQPFDINEGAKLDLGSTAKLRTLITYLEIVANIHAAYSDKSADELRRVEVDPRDRLTRWAIDYLGYARDKTMRAMLEAAMDRQYSASVNEQFFTGGGLHTFENFNKDDNGRVMPVREAFRNSVNLVFVRMMRDIVRHHMFNIAGSSARLLTDEKDPRRREYLARFADREGRVFSNRFYQKYRGKSAVEAEQLLLQGVRPTRDRLAAIFRTIDSAASVNALSAFLTLRSNDSAPSDEALAQLYERYDPKVMSLADRGYVAGVHPLELWVVGYLREHPGATQKEVIEASADERQAVYAWLFNTRHKNVQDRRIMGLLELEGFLEIHRAWARLGYPFDSLVPSYATALGSSADRPAALAELMGIVANDGRRLPMVRLTTLHFAAGTPYETFVARTSSEGARVLPAELTQVVRRALMDVTMNGTARRLRGAFVRDDASEIAIGGKTGTGDNRFDTYGSRGQLLQSRVVNRSATFVFFLGERYFGTMTAYVAGEDAEKFQFTSALSVQILKSIAPTLLPLLKDDKSVYDPRPPAVEAPYPELVRPKRAKQKEAPEGVIKPQ